MANAKRVILLGLGTFGSALAKKLAKNGCKVTGVDSCKERVEPLKEVLYEAIIGDVTDRALLSQLALEDATALVISLGDNIAPSLLAALHGKELGARQMIVKGVTREHERLLKHLGVQRVVFPETEIAEELADQLTWPNVLDFLPIDPDYSLVELAVSSSFNGKTLQEADIRRKYNVWVLGVKDALTGRLSIFPGADFRLVDDQLMLVIGKTEDLNRLKELT